MKHLPLVLLLAAGCAASPTTHGLRSAENPPRTAAPVASEGFRLVWEEPGRGPGIGVLLDEYARVTGQVVTMTGETRQVVDKKRLDKAGGEDALEVPAQDVQHVTEALLAMHQFALIPLYGGEPRIVQVISLETQERNFVRRSATFVPSEELDAWRGRSATLITTSLWLPNTDVRTLSNSMRTMLTDANTQQIVPVGNSNALLLIGFASDVCALAELLRGIDAQTAPAVPAPAQAADPKR